MGRIAVTAYVTLDGVIEAPGGGEEFEHLGWSFEFNRGDDGDEFKLGELMAADAQLLGRVTYEIFAKAWPSMTDDAGFADRMNGMPKYVVSTTMSDDDADWSNSTVIRDDVPGRISNLREETDGDILVAGSARLVETLADNDLVDEYRLMVFPIVLGSGKRLFGDGATKRRMRLADSRPRGPDGILLLTYEPVRDA
jgi:dihydrofolate reductase